MKVDEAIRLNGLLVESDILDPILMYKESVKLGLEALTRLQCLRLGKKDYHSIPLPGETLDQ